MYRYLKAAFLFAPQISGLGKVPVNLVWLAGCAILGFVRPEFLLLGMGLETAYLFSLASSKRFQRLVNSETAALENSESDYRLKGMVARLKSSSKARLKAQEDKCRRILEAYKDSSTPALLASENSKALDRLLYAYVALLLNREKLEALSSESSHDDLPVRITKIETQLAQDDLPETVRSTLKATLEILRRRLENQTGRAASLNEIDSAMTRIEAQLDLALENAMMPGRQYAITADIEVASQLLDEQNFADLSTALSEFDRREESPRVRE